MALMLEGFYRGEGKTHMTHPELAHWAPRDAKYRRSEVCSNIGAGDHVWERATAEVLRWGVKTASGFAVSSAASVAPGDRVEVTAHVLGVTVREPVEVLTVVVEPTRVGFSYRTLPGHPVCGEESFVVTRDGDQVHLTVRSLTRAAPQQPWRALYPVLLMVQRVVRRRYLRSLL